jgi:hypothetical protein
MHAPYLNILSGDLCVNFACRIVLQKSFNIPKIKKTSVIPKYRRQRHFYGFLKKGITIFTITILLNSHDVHKYILHSLYQRVQYYNIIIKLSEYEYSNIIAVVKVALRFRDRPLPTQ